MNRISTITLLIALSLSASLTAFSKDTQPESHLYPLTTCVVSGESLADGYVSVTHEGQEVRLCCTECRKDFAKDPATYLKKLRSSQKSSAETYPLDTCVVSGSKLGSMGEPYVHTVGDTVVKFCCKGCVPTFKKNPARYLKKLETAKTKDAEPAPHQGHDHSGHQH